MNKTLVSGPTKHLTIALAAIGGPLAGILAATVLPMLAGSAPPEACTTAGVLVWMAVWWLTEAVPLAITSLLPLVLFPLLGVMTGKDAAAPYADRIIFLYLGGFFLAFGMEKWGLHKRIGLTALLFFGTRPAAMIAGIMLVTGLISMWVSNTATAMMMLPIGMSLIARMEADNTRDAAPFATCMMLAIAYAANIGGVGTPVGTPPNAIMIAFLDRHFGVKIGFLEWALVGVPFAIAFLFVAWLYLTRIAFSIRGAAITGGRDSIRRDLAALGPMTRPERWVMIVFFLTVAGWMLREPFAAIVPAWKDWITGRIDDTTVALVGGILLFLIPADLKRREFIMDWKTATRLPWDVLLLFGGGLSLATAVQSSGLDDVLAGAFGATHDWPYWLVVLTLVTAAAFLSEITSNTAQANLFMPILAGVAAASGVEPISIIAPCTLAFSCAFMLPMGTPPNAIVFGSGRVTIPQMAKAGFALNLIAITLIMLAAHTLIAWSLPQLN